jgi:NTE family protein
MFQNLVISGGSTKTIAVLGCIKYLEEKDLMKNIRTFVGTSAGAILSFFLTLGYGVVEIEDFIRNEIFKKNLNNINMDEVMNLSFFDTYGLDSGANAIKIFSLMLQKKYNKLDISFKDLAKVTGKNIIICVANITKGCSEHFSIDTQPEFSVITALRMSISLPFIFTPIKYKNCLYVDGGIYETLPTRYVVENQSNPLKETLAIRTKVSKKEKQVENVLQFTRLIFGSLVAKLNGLQVHDTQKITLIDIQFDDIDMAAFSFNDMSFFLSEQYIQELMEKGYNTMIEKFT